MSTVKKPYKKVPLSAIALVKKLKSRGMVFSKGWMSKAADIFENHISYYRLRAYWITLEDCSNPSRPFKPNTSFERVLELYNFDKELRNILSRAIGVIEIALRAKFSNTSIIFKKSHFHLNPSHAQNINVFVECFNRMNRSVNVSKDEKFIKHYNSHYSDPVTPPVWSYIEVSSIGELNSWIKNLKPTSITDKIAHGFKLGNSKVFISFLDRLRIFRNICAHHGRIWNTRFEKRKLTIPQQPPDLNSAWNSGNNTDSSFYGMFLMMFFVLKHLDKSEAEHLLESFKNISNQYNIDINELGFSLNWLNETIFDN